MICRLALGVGIASLGLLACNMLSGADGLVAETTSAESDVGVPRGSAGTSGSSGHDHTPPTGTGTPPGSSGSSGGVIDDGGIDAASEAAASLPTFTDDFNRPDTTSVGNGWVEKTPGAFPVVAGAAQQSQTGIYRNLFVARPASENVLDVLVQATVMFPNTMADPCLFARIQPASIQKDRFVGYSVYPDGPDYLYISRDDGQMFNDVGSAAISPALVPGMSYRLSLQVTGANPVHLVGSISKLDGTVIAAITASDSNAKQITVAGVVGFGSSVAGGGRFDDFRRVTLP